MQRMRQLWAVALLVILLTLVGCTDLVVNLESTDVESVEETVASVEPVEATEVVVATEAVQATEATAIAVVEETASYTFRSQDLFDQHYNKHGQEFGDISQEEYLRLANELFNSEAALRKTESDGDALFYDPESNTFGVLSQDGYIRTCFKPDDGIDYWNRQ